MTYLVIVGGWSAFVGLVMCFAACARRGERAAETTLFSHTRPRPARSSGTRPVTLAATAALTLCAPAVAQADVGDGGLCANAAAIPSTSDVERTRLATRCLINRERASRGLRPLTRHLALWRAAVGHSRDMAQRGYFSHRSLGGGSAEARVRAAGYPTGRAMVAENLGWGSGALASPAAIVRSWMASPAHRATILHPRLRELGVGIARSGDRTLYTAKFGARH